MARRSTVELEHVRVSESLLPEVQRKPHLEIAGPCEPIVFDPAGNITLGRN